MNVNRQLEMLTIIRAFIILFTGCAMGGFVTLQFNTVRAQDRQFSSERIAITEMKLEGVHSDVTRLEMHISSLEKTVSDNRDKIASQDAKIATINGIGIALGAAVGLLQCIQILIGKSLSISKGG